MQLSRWIRSALLVFGVGALLLTHASASQGVECKQADIAADLLSGDYHRVNAALGAIPIYPEPDSPDSKRYWHLEPGFTASPPLVEALIRVLEKETEQYDRMDSGETYEIMPGEMLFSILHTVIALNDPQTIPSLMRNAHTGWGVKNALLDFGPQIVDDAIDCASSPGRALVTAAGCFSILEEAVERWPEGLDSNTRDRITHATLLQLTCQDAAYRNKNRPNAGFRPLAAAIRLAEVLKAEELSEAIALLADGDRETWRTCGFDKQHTGLQSEAKSLLEDLGNRRERQ